MTKVTVILVLWLLCQSIDGMLEYPTLSPCEEPPKPGLDFYCVVPKCDVLCPSECMSRCSDLQFFTSNVTDFFTSNTTFKFIKGTHEHVHTFTVEGITQTNLNFTSITPEDTVIIHCSAELEVGFIFNGSFNISIQNMAFFDCGQRFDSPHHQPFQSALAFIHNIYVMLERVRVGNSTTQGLTVIGVQKCLSIISSSFNKSGHWKKQTNSSSYIAGNTIFAEANTSTDYGNLTIIVLSSSFISNTNRPSCADASYDGNNQLNYCHCDHLASGLSVILRRPNVSVNLTKLTLSGNHGCSGGNLAIVFNTTSPFTGNVTIDNCTISNGRATFGGGLYIFYLSAPTGCNDDNSYLPELVVSNNTVVLRNTLVESNTALTGGGFYFKLTESQSTCNQIEISMSDNCTFHKNSLSFAGYGGVAIASVIYVSFQYLKQIIPQFKMYISDCTFKEHYYANNSKWNNSGSGVIYLKTNHHVMIKNIAIYGNNYSGIVIVDSNLIVSGLVEIHNNSGSSGGGMLFCSNAVMFLTPNTTLNIYNNSAQHAGGGICVEDQCLQSKPMCFFQVDYVASVNPEKSNNITVSLSDNHAEYAGDQIYGGSIDSCYLIDSPFYNVSRHIKDSKQMYHHLFEIYPNDSSSVTSPQRRVCLCNENNGNVTPTCFDDTNSSKKSYFPGEPFNLSVVVVGQLDGIVPGTVYAELKQLEDKTVTVSQELGEGEDVQRATGKNCNYLNYTIYTNYTYANLSLSVQFVGDKSFAEHLPYFQPLIVQIDIKDCPIGFYRQPTHEKQYEMCDCILKLKHQFHCYIANKTIIPKSGNWIGHREDEHNTTHNNITIIYSIGCTLDYCKNTNPDYSESQAEITSTITTFTDEDNQCDFNRTGILCGKCPKNYSVKLGSSHCSPSCSNTSLLLIPLFALMGILLVVLLMALNMTVTEGTINGLLFYANVVQISNKVFFRGQNIPFLTRLFKVFIAWLNLDFGVSACLYRGMDDYSKVWLQFVFPVYIWIITGVIIYLSRRFTLVARLVNRNGTKVLATLMLLSYSKMLRASIVAIHFKKLVHIDQHGIFQKFTYCWYSDCNVSFMNGKHIPLGIVGAVSIVCLLPFAFLLLFADVLNKIRFLTCMWKLKPFLDTYTGPYTNEGRYWTGLLLVIRCGLFLASSLNHASRTTSLTITMSSMVMIPLLIVPWFLQLGIYRKRWLNILECSFLLNLAVFTTGTQYLLFYNTNYKPAVLTHVSIGIAFIIFVFILLYHICQFKSVQKVYFKINNITRRILAKKINTHSVNEQGTSDSTQGDSDEDLLSVSNFPPLARFDKDREPLLSDISN